MHYDTLLAHLGMAVFRPMAGVCYRVTLYGEDNSMRHAHSITVHNFLIIKCLGHTQQSFYFRRRMNCTIEAVMEMFV